jgi:hypothetical protein
MIYRKLTANNDYTFGLGSGNFYNDVPEAVAQAVRTRLWLITGEWFLDITEGTPYNSQILGAGTIGRYDAAIQDRILGTPGVTEIVEYASSVNPDNRMADIGATIDTIYGQAAVSGSV